MPTLDSEAPKAPPLSTRTKLARRAISVWLVLHLSSHRHCGSASGLTRRHPSCCSPGWKTLRPYLQVLYLDHGYHFFAPEPGESTLLAFVAERPDGTVVRGRLPDKAVQPRLLYHRYFMLTEHMNKAPEGLRQAWYDSYARHIGHVYVCANGSA